MFFNCSNVNFSCFGKKLYTVNLYFDHKTSNKFFELLYLRIHKIKTMGKSDKLYDLSGISEIVGGDENEINELNKMFLVETPKSLSSLNEYVEDKNWLKASAIAHKLKSSVRLWNISVIDDTIVQIEQKAKNSAYYHEIPVLLENLNKVLKEVLSQLQEEVDK